MHRYYIDMRSSKEIDEIIKLHDDGYSYGYISKKFSINKSTIAYYCNEKRSGNVVERINRKERQNDEYENIVCSIIKDSSNIYQVCRKLHIQPTNNNYDRIKRIIEKYGIDTSHFKTEQYRQKREKLEDSAVFCQREKNYNTNTLKKRLFNGGYKEYKCEICGLEKWMDKDIILQVHHKNGNRTDNRLENLQILCPNCHSQTESFCVGIRKTKGERKHRKKDIDAASEQKKREALISVLRECNGNVLKMGRYLGISDNAVRKRLKKLGLPHKKKEITAFLIEN